MEKYDLGDEPMFTHIESEGINLRDWFAGMALQGMLARSQRYRARDGRSDWYSAIAEEAYEISDALLKAKREVEE